MRQTDPRAADFQLLPGNRQGEYKRPAGRFCGFIWIENVQVACSGINSGPRPRVAILDSGRQQPTPYDIAWRYAKEIACEGRLVVFGGLSASHFFDNVLQGIRPLIGLLFGFLFGDSVSLLDAPH